MTAPTGTFAGTWKSFYRYSSSSRGEDFWGQHVLAVTQTGDKIHLESTPDSKSQVTIDLQLSEDGRAATGTWRERTEPDGYYKGAVYDGTIELEVSPGGDRMSGTWHGKGKDGADNSDIWELVKEDAPEAS